MATQKKPARKRRPAIQDPEGMAMKILGNQQHIKGGKEDRRVVSLDKEQIVSNCSLMLSLAYLPKVDRTNAAEVRERIQLYFSKMAENNQKPTVASLALSLGIDRKTLWTWMTGYTPVPDEVVAELKTAYAIINAEMESYVIAGGVNPVGTIFLMKNNHGYSDKTEVELSGDNRNAGQSREELDAKYASSIVPVVDIEPVEE